ncbi:class I SAM-dependent methyltransferase [Actomonas aquatica]|uniref:Class I SAM-dependent methyltransferase n=1 Tax=Actomonas aquatica TaxID=2866162 RepID=A0ABZ1CAI8_9BACT|nr:class I SAM-dependent methyltransferase [Opitutus sp. WL0086]WRQ88400.1 class I SAM-dependent methyltransferase [Opitutus sp. WL0086]
MRTRLAKWYAAQHYEPGAWGWLVNPFYLARRALHRNLKEILPRLSGDLLDVGCGTKPYRALIRAHRYVGLDYDTPLRRGAGDADVFYDGGVFPFADAEFDHVLCSQVLEHVFNSDEFLQQIARVLKPSGDLVLTVPFVWDEHEQPHDFARYSSFGLRALLERAGFEIIEHRRTLSDLRVLFQLFNAYLFKVTLSRHQRLNQLCTLVFMAPVTLLGMLIGRVFPRNTDFFLDHVVVARKRVLNSEPV